jgi:phosphatidylglycerol:prolipoprotein diacylglycerol transferase
MDLVNVRKGGLVAYGGFLGGFLGSWLYLRRVKIRLLPWADVVVPTLASGLGITRIGCFLYGCDYGRPIPADAPAWVQAIGVRFPNWGSDLPRAKGAPAFLHHVHDGLVSYHAELSALVYPTQLLEVLNGWVIFAVLMVMRKRTRFRGQMFLLFTGYYGITRALMEVLRGDTGRGGLGPLSTSQIVGIATFLAAVAAWIYLSRKAHEHPAEAMALGPGAVPEEERRQRKAPGKGQKKRS